MKKTKKKFLAIFAFACAAVLVLALGGCSAQEESSASSAESQAEPTAEAEQAASALRIVSMKGPTSVGLASMMQQEQGQFTVVGSADEVGPLLLQDEADIALVPANLAATLYSRTEGQIRVIDVNTLGVLYVVTGDESVSSVEALRGKTIYMTGAGTVPEYTLRALLDASGMSMDDVDVQFKSEPAEVAALLVEDKSAVGILPQPYATSVTIKDADIKMTLDLTDAWEEATGGDAGSIVTGVTIAKASTVEENPEAIAAFLANHAASAQAAVDDPTSIAQTVVDLGIIDSAPIAEKAIPLCNVCCLTGVDMKAALSGYLQALYDQDPASIGGALPGDDFYYED